MLFLHPYREATSAWAWMKMALPFTRKGLNCVFVDLPGFNKSTVAQHARCDPSKWMKYSVDIISAVLETLRLPKVHIVAAHEA